MTEYEQRLTNECTRQHPDHYYLLQVRGQPVLWTAWCTLCDRMGFNSDDAHNRPNRAMTQSYVDAVTQAACLVYQEEMRLTVERREKRKTR